MENMKSKSNEFLKASDSLRLNFRRDLKNNFVFLSCLVTEDFYILVRNGMNAASKLLKVNSVFTGSEGTDVNTVNNLIHEAINIGYNGLAINIFAPEVFDCAIDHAIKKGIPVVGFNIDENNKGKNKRYSTISQDFISAGETLGKKAKNYLYDKKSILLTQHTANVSALIKRKEGILRGIGSTKNKIKIYDLITGNMVKDATSIITKFLEHNPGIGTIICTGLADTEASGLAVKQLNLDCKIFGFDTSINILNLINEGYIIYAVDQQAYTQGFYPVIQLYLNSSFDFIPYSLDAGRALISKENVNKLLIPENEGIRF